MIDKSFIFESVMGIAVGDHMYNWPRRRYDMTISDSMYGAAKRYVTRERVEAMLDYEVRRMHSVRNDCPLGSL